MGGPLGAPCCSGGSGGHACLHVPPWRGGERLNQNDRAERPRQGRQRSEGAALGGGGLLTFVRLGQVASLRERGCDVDLSERGIESPARVQQTGRVPAYSYRFPLYSSERGICVVHLQKRACSTLVSSGRFWYRSGAGPLHTFDFPF